MLAIFSSTYLLKPSISDTTTITVATPKITPSRVRNERSLCAQMASRASFTDSKIFIAAFLHDVLRIKQHVRLMKQEEHWREIGRKRSRRAVLVSSLICSASA